MRNMSFSKTTQQVRDKDKTVTRRFGWGRLRRGEQVCAIEKGMGLKKGEKVVRLATIEVIKTNTERVDAITTDDVVKEGFPNLTPEQFIDDVLLKDARIKIPGTNRTRPARRDDLCNRIEFKYV